MATSDIKQQKNKCRIIYPDHRFKDEKEEKKERANMRETGKRFDVDKCSKLSKSCFYGYFDEFIQEINNKSFDVNCYFETESEWSLLHFTMFGRKRCLDVMKDKADNYEHMKIIKYLIDNIAINIDIQSKWGYSILTECVANTTDIKLIQYLLENNANPNLKNIFGTTPLISAVLCENLEAIKLLCTYGADPRIANDFDGITPIKLSKCFAKIFMYLTKVKLDLDRKEIHNKQFTVIPIVPPIKSTKNKQKKVKEDEKNDEFLANNCCICGGSREDKGGLFQCSRCKGPRKYCSVECQRKDWRQHKKLCKK